MEEKDCIIGFSSNYSWDIIKYWVNSLNRCGFTGDKVLIVGNCSSDTIKKIQSENIFVVVAGQLNEFGDAILNNNFAPHVERFFYLYHHLSQNSYRYVITTDVRDVIFQKNPIEYIEKLNPQNCIFSSESIRYRDEPWGNNNLKETFGDYIHGIFKDRLIYNVGILAGKYNSIMNLLMAIAANSVNRPIKVCDQAVFNFLNWTSNSNNILLDSEDGWACNLGTTADPMKINDFRPYLIENVPILRDDMVCTSNGNEFFIVHQYDRVPVWRNVLEKKYV